MKKPLTTILFATLLFSVKLSAQFNVQAGASAVVSQTPGIGGELTGNLELKRDFSIGIGIRPIKFEEHRHLYLPVYGSFKLYHPLSKGRLFASIDPGYGIYPSENSPDPFSDMRRKGAIYLSGGVGIMGNSKFSPYVSIHFTKFGFTEKYNIYSQYRPISTFAFTAGLVINQPSSTKPITDKPRELPVARTKEYYLAKSKRQKTTAWILLSGGITLITSGFIIASNQDEGVEAAIPLVLISGPGIVTSLISIPFFISSAHNKKRAARLSSTVVLQQGPINYKGSAYKDYPAVGVKVEF